MNESPRGTAALAVGVVATAAFAALRALVALGGHEASPLDVWWHDLMVSLTNPVWVVIAWVPAIVGGTIGMIIVGAAILATLLWRRRRWEAATLAIAMVSVVAIGATMAAVIARSRPADSLAESVATSFPSGHTAVATTVTVVLCMMARRWQAWVIGALWVLLMMWSRTYLQAHWVSDVVAGLFEGIAVATTVWAAMLAIRSRRAALMRDDSSDFAEPTESTRIP